MGENWFFCFTSVVLCALPSAARRTSGVPMQTLSFTSHLVQKRHVPLHHRQISETSSKNFFFFVFCWLVECISQKDARKNNHLCKGNIIFLGTHIRNKMFGCSQNRLQSPLWVWCVLSLQTHRLLEYPCQRRPGVKIFMLYLKVQHSSQPEKPGWKLGGYGNTLRSYHNRWPQEATQGLGGLLHLRRNSWLRVGSTSLLLAGERRTCKP